MWLNSKPAVRDNQSFVIEPVQIQVRRDQLTAWLNSYVLGPGRTGQIFAYFAKKFVTSCLGQVRPVNFRSTKFCQGLPNFKDAVVLPQSRTNFCQA